MKILIAPDKFKGSLSAKQVCKAISLGLQKERLFDTSIHPMADGGDGSLEVLSEHLSLESHLVATLDPLGRSIFAKYYSSGQAAFIEVASASGIVLLTETERNPLLTSTYGTGIMLADAIDRGCEKIYLFLGGSSTNDAGMGIASALGWQFLDKEKNILEPIGKNLSLVHFTEKEPLIDQPGIQLILLCDVDNPLFGPDGAAKVYASQKGASPDDIIQLDNGLKNFAEVIFKKTGKKIGEMPGMGASGGIGASMTGLFDASLNSGFSTLAELTGLEKMVQEADIVISGEGKLDHQSFHGKVVGGMAGLCMKHQKPLFLFTGINEMRAVDLQATGVIQVFEIMDLASSLEDAILNGAVYLERMAFALGSAIIKSDKFGSS